MKTIQVEIEESMLTEVERATRALEMTCEAFVRTAWVSHEPGRRLLAHLPRARQAPSGAHTDAQLGHPYPKAPEAHKCQMSLDRGENFFSRRLSPGSTGETRLYFGPTFSETNGLWLTS